MSMGLKKQKKLNNQGFSLVEVLVSIVILSILLVPILHGFVSAAKVNAKAKEIQKATLLAQNLMEGIKSKSLESVVLEFNGAKDFDLVHTDLSGSDIGYTLKSYGDEGYGEFVRNGTTYQRVMVGDVMSSVDVTLDGAGTPIYTYSPHFARNQFYFGMEQVEDQGEFYDVVVTLDTGAYSDSAVYPDTMNNYQFPRLLDLDEDAVAMIDLEQHSISPDDQAVADFYNIRLSYLAYLSSLPIPTGTPSPIPNPLPATITMTEIEDNTNKKIEVLLDKDLVNKRMYVTCQIQYECSLDLNEDGMNEQLTPVIISRGNYPLPTDGTEEGNVFLFYTPSRFTNKDSIQITNKGTKSNFYIVNQKEDNVSSKVRISKSEEMGGSLEVYSNLKDTQKNDFVTRPYLYTKNAVHNRIYEIIISIYPGGTLSTYPYGDGVVTLTSTKEDQ